MSYARGATNRAGERMQLRSMMVPDPVHGATLRADAAKAPPTGAGHERWWVTSALLLPALVLLLVLSLASCGRPMGHTGTAATIGNAERGGQALARYGCGACHTVSGVRGAHGKVGPPLDGVRERSIIAGEAPNTPENMVQWIRNPQSIEPNTAMPNLGVDEITARDTVAYLYGRR